MGPDKTLSIDTDIPRLKKGLVGGQFFAAYVASSFIEKGGAKFALEQIHIIDRFTKRSPSLELARTADDIMRIHAKGKIVSLIGIEGRKGVGAQHPSGDAGGGASGVANPAHARPIHCDDRIVALGRLNRRATRHQAMP